MMKLFKITYHVEHPYMPPIIRNKHIVANNITDVNNAIIGEWEGCDVHIKKIEYVDDVIVADPTETNELIDDLKKKREDFKKRDEMDYEEKVLDQLFDYDDDDDENPF